MTRCSPSRSSIAKSFNALFAVHDLNRNVLRIREMLEEELGEEEEDLEEDEP